jgi:guanine nucleotide-binding protein G(I)/G(S)/G(T) subunit beta-1
MNIVDAIAQAKQETTKLQEQIKTAKESTNDGKLKEAKVNELGPIKLKSRKILKGHLAKIFSLGWSSDSQQIVSASQDGKLIIWNALTTLKVQAVPLKSHWVMTCAYAPSGNLLECGGLDNICSLYNIKTDSTKPYRELTAHTGYLSCCKFISDRHIVTSSGDMSCILWDIELNQPSIKFLEHTGDVMSIAISPDQQTFVSGSCDAHAKLWDVRTGKCTHTFTGHESDINSVQFFPNGLSFGTGSEDSTCKLFDIRADRELNTFNVDSVREGVTSICFSKSGRLLFSAYETKNVLVYDTIKGNKVQELTDHESRISCLEVSPDGFALATGSWDMSLRIYA